VALPVFFTELYESDAGLLVQVGRENTDTPPTVQRGQVISQGVQSADINSEVQILSERALVEEVVDRLGPDAFKNVLVKPDGGFALMKYYLRLGLRQVKTAYKEFLIAAGLEKRLTPREEAILKVADGVKVEPVRDSDVLQLKVRMPSAKLCVDVANTLLDGYFRRRAAIRRPSAGSSFFEQQVQEASARLESADRARAEVRARWNLAAPEEQRSSYLKELSGIQSEMVQNQAEIARLRGQRAILQQREQTLPDLVKKEQTDSNNPSIQSIKERVTTLRLDRAKLESRYQPDSQTMKNIDGEIADLEALLAGEQGTIRSSVTEETNPEKRDLAASVELQGAQIAGLQQRDDYLKQPEAEFSKQLKNLDSGIDALQKAEREYQLSEQEYLEYAKRLDEARMSEELDSHRVANVTVAQPPETPIAPVYPRKLFLIEISMAVSLLLGLGIAALLETTEDRIMDEQSILQVPDLPYLGTVEV
jgi:uncharacterized protein involved in exopolysaccharide biosynthesis